MKLYSQAVLIAAFAGPALCQYSDATRAIADQAAKAAEQAVEAQSAAKGISDEKMAQVQEKLAEIAQRFDSDKMAEIEAKAAAAAEKAVAQDSELQDKVQAALARAQEKLESLDMSDFQAKIAAAEDKIFELKGLDKLSTLPELEKLEVLPNLDFKFEFDSDKLADIAESASKIATNFNMAFLQDSKPFPAPAAPPAPPGPKIGRISIGRGDGEYDNGTRALDQHHYEEAVLRFDQVINSKSSRADGALYWKAYALNREGKRDEALAALATLRKDYPSSAWLNDAGALETEIKQGSGQPISPAQESNDDMKLLAINSLMSADPDRAIPLVEGILRGNSPPNVKRNALFVLTQSRSPKAQQVISDYAKGGGNPDLQLAAIQYLGQTGTRDVQQQLTGIYGSSNDMRVKSSIIDSLISSRAYDALLNIAKNEKDANLRNRAIRNLAGNKNFPIDGLVELYPSADNSAKSAIIDGLQSRRDVKTMIDLSRKETDPQMKRRIVERIADMHDNKDAMDYMMELLK